MYILSKLYYWPMLFNYQLTINCLKMLQFTVALIIISLEQLVMS